MELHPHTNYGEGPGTPSQGELINTILSNVLRCLNVESMRILVKRIEARFPKPEKEPLFVNSLGEKFYEGDEVWWVSFYPTKLMNYEINYISPVNFKCSSDSTEIMTEKSAKKWLEEHKK